ncbi:MAG: stage II sporulation protein M [Planctomycetota bacterium]
METFQLRSTQFRREREAAWQELDGLLRRVDRSGVRSLSALELGRLPVLYRGALSSLSVARAISLDRNVIQYLQGLVGRAYVVVYTNKRSFLQVVVEFLSARFPQLVRQYRWHVLASTLVLGAGTATGFIQTLNEPERYYSFVDAGLAAGRDPSATTESLRDALYYQHDPDGGLVTFASFLFVHNSKIGIMCFALGFVPAIAVFYLLFTNGLMLGAFAALFHSRGLSREFWAWILPHGFTELTAIVLCGAAGLALGESLVFPGASGRLQNLARKGREAGNIVIGAAFMLCGAGLIEGIFRQMVHSVPVRYSVAVATALLWIGYFHICGRRRR